MNPTQMLKEKLVANGFSQGIPLMEYSSPLIGKRGDVTYTFLGSGWVQKFYRECPASEGWYLTKHRVTEFLGCKAKSLY